MKLWHSTDPWRRNTVVYDLYDRSAVSSCSGGMVREGVSVDCPLVPRVTFRKTSLNQKDNSEKQFIIMMTPEEAIELAKQLTSAAESAKKA